jgi:hypothetical protein
MRKADMQLTTNALHKPLKSCALEFEDFCDTFCWASSHYVIKLDGLLVGMDLLENFPAQNFDSFVQEFWKFCTVLV